MYNSWEVIGNLGNDPETHASKKEGGKSFTTFSIAVNKRKSNREDKPLWVNVTVFGAMGEAAAQYLKKGSTALVRGELELQEYEAKDGTTKTSLKLLAGDVVYLSKKESSEGATVASKSSGKGGTAVMDEDIPF